MKITIDVDIENNEGTDSPWWTIVIPRQNLRKDSNACHNIAGMIVGPFFSRDKAQAHLDSRRYEYGSNAVVYCHSGYWSHEYKTALRKQS
jgi:hypothetical protein